MTTGTQETHLLDHPDDGPLFGWTLGEVLTMMDDHCNPQTDEELGQAALLREFIQQARPEERYQIFHVIDKIAADYTEHIAECANDVIHEAHERILAIAQGRADLPRMDFVEHGNINRRMLQRRLLDFRLLHHLEDREDLRAALVGIEQHAEADRIIQEVITEHQEELGPLTARVAGRIIQRFEQEFLVARAERVAG